MTRFPIRFALAISLALPVLVAGDADAARLSAADRAWIDTCIAQRKESKTAPAALRNYCSCMHDIVDDNRPYGITELEREYPPAHASCRAKSRTR